LANKKDKKTEKEEKQEQFATGFKKYREVYLERQ
jgi:hypothetical protein